MALKKSDYVYLFLTIVLAAIAAFALGHPETQAGLYIGLGLAGVIMLLAIIFVPSIGASILIVAIFTNISSQLTDHGYTGIIKPLVAVIFIAIMVRNYYTGQMPKSLAKTWRVWFFLVIYLVVVGLSYLVADNKARAFEAVQDLFKDIMIMVTILLALRSERDWKRAVWVAIITIVLLSLLGIYQVVTHNYTQDYFGLATYFLNNDPVRIGGPIHDPNMWGQVLVAVIPLVIFRMIHEKKAIVKWISLAFLLVLLFEVANTYSRGAYLSLAVIVVMTLFVFEKTVDLRAAIVILGLLVVVYSIIPEAYRERFASLTALNPTSQGGIYSDLSLRGRSSEVLTGLSMFADHPLLGVGAGNFLNNYQVYAQQIGIELRAEERDPHSLVIQVAAETGVFGIIAFSGILISLWIAINKAKLKLRHQPESLDWVPWLNSLQVSIIGYLVASLFLHGAYIRYFWILIALAITAIQLVDEEQLHNKQITKPRV